MYGKSNEHRKTHCDFSFALNSIIVLVVLLGGCTQKNLTFKLFSRISQFML